MRTYHNDDYIFEDLDGNKIKRVQLVEKILQCIGEDKKTCLDISKELNYKYQVIKNILRKLVLNEVLEAKPSKNYTYYSQIKNSCLLADLLYNEEKILKNFTTKGRKVYKVEDGKNVSYKSNYHGADLRNGSIWDTIFESGE